MLSARQVSELKNYAFYCTKPSLGFLQQMSTVSFSSTYTQFLEELKGTFPEYSPALLLASSLPNTKARFLEVWRIHTNAVASSDGSIFAGAGLELVPGFVMTGTLWGELSATTQTAVWKYISSLLLLAASESEKDLWDISGFQHDMEEMMKKLKEAGAEGGMGGLGGMMGDIFAKLGKMGEAFGIKYLSGAAGKFKIPERLFKGHIAKIAEELVKEFKPEDFGISPEMLETDDPARVFMYLQEVFTKKPEMMMTAAQKIAKKIQAKFQRGEIKREDIIREAEELMAEFSENEAFSSMFGSLSEMMKGSEKESGNEGSARRREVQERLRKKQAEKDAKKAGSGSGSGNVVVNSEAEARAEAAAAALLMEEGASKKPTVVKKRK